MLFFSTQSVTAATFKYSIERSLDPRTNGPATAYLGDIVGVVWNGVAQNRQRDHRMQPVTAALEDWLPEQDSNLRQSG